MAEPADASSHVLLAPDLLRSKSGIWAKSPRIGGASSSKTTPRQSPRPSPRHSPLLSGLSPLQIAPRSIFSTQLPKFDLDHETPVADKSAAGAGAAAETPRSPSSAALHASHLTTALTPVAMVAALTASNREASVVSDDVAPLDLAPLSAQALAQAHPATAQERAVQVGRGADERVAVSAAAAISSVNPIPDSATAGASLANGAAISAASPTETAHAGAPPESVTLDLRHSATCSASSPATPAPAAPHSSPPPANDTPLTDAYLARRVFWVDLGAALLLGATIGVFSFCFLACVTHVTEAWMGADEHTPSTYRGFPNNLLGDDVSGFGTGPWWWIAVTGGGGLLLGACKWATAYPQGEVPSFLQEIRHAHVDPWTGWRTAFGGLVSLSAGASVGPEYPLSAMGGALATWVGTRVSWSPARAQNMTLVGMCAAMGSIFASPVLAVLLIIELAGLNATRNAEAVALLFAGAGASFAVFLACAATGLTYLTPNLGPGTAAQFSMGWSMVYLLIAIPLGVIAGLLATLMLIVRGALTKVIDRVHERAHISRRSTASLVLLPLVGGVLIGLVAVAAPLTIGDGSVPLSSIAGDGYKSMWARTYQAFYTQDCAAFGPTACVGTSAAANQTRAIAQLQAQVQLQSRQYAGSLSAGWPNPEASDRTYSAQLLIGTMLLKMIAWSLSQSCGFVGGIMFPFFFVGAAAGNLAAQWTGVNQSFATVVLLFAVPGAMCPLPFTFLAMGAFLFECSSYQTGAIFVAMLAAHAVATGSGVLHRLVGAPTLGAWADEAPGWRDPHSYATHARGAEAVPPGELKTA